MTVTELPLAPALRTEIEVAADAAWSLIDAGLIPRTTKVSAIADAIGITVDDLRVASVRAERVPLERRRPRGDRETVAMTPPRPSTTGRQRETPVAPPPPTPQLPPEAYDRPQLPRPGDRGQDRPKLTDAGRRGAAEAVFAQWKVRGHLDCTRCGRTMESGTEVVVTAAHHAGGCP